jgi:hypothetical protein
MIVSHSSPDALIRQCATPPPANKVRSYGKRIKMNTFDVAVCIAVLAIGLLFVPERYDPHKLFVYFREWTAGLILMHDLGRILHGARTIRED